MAEQKKTVEEYLEGCKEIGKPEVSIKVTKETVEDNGKSIKRKTTSTTTKQEYHNASKTTKLTKITYKVVTEDTHPDGSVITKTSEKVSLSEELLASSPVNTEVEAALKGLTPCEEPEEVMESNKTEQVKEKDLMIKQTTVTKIVKTKFCDQTGTAKKLKTVTTVTTTKHQPDGSAQSAIETSIEIACI